MKIFLEKKKVITLAQMLHGWIKHTKLRQETKMLGFWKAKHVKAHENVLKNVSKAFPSFGKLRKPNIWLSHEFITIFYVELETLRIQMVTMMSKFLQVTRKTLWRHPKFRIHINKYDKIACWALICKQPYHYRLP